MREDDYFDDAVIRYRASSEALEAATEAMAALARLLGGVPEHHRDLVAPIESWVKLATGYLAHIRCEMGTWTIYATESRWKGRHKALLQWIDSTERALRNAHQAIAALPEWYEEDPDRDQLGMWLDEYERAIIRIKEGR
jgi:hypothetical protein